MRIALLANWYVWRQRPHHFADAANRLGHAIDLYFPRGLRSTGPELRPPNRHRGPLLLPERLTRFGAVRAVNGALHRRCARRFFEAPANVSVYSHPPVHEVTGRPAKLVYDCLDDWGAFRPPPPGFSPRLEEGLCERADRIWVVSRALARRFEERWGAKVRLVPNGVDYDHFARVPSLRRPHARRTAGYMGMLAPWLHAELLHETAKRLPEWDFELAGPDHELSPRQRSLLTLPNIRLLGRLPYEDLPRLLAGWDVATIPFELSPLIEATSPIKLYEYLAAGVPVASTPMAEVVAHAEAGVVACANEPEGFAQALVSLASEARVERCQQVGAQAAWVERFRPALAELQDDQPAGGS